MKRPQAFQWLSMVNEKENDNQKNNKLLRDHEITKIILNKI